MLGAITLRAYIMIAVAVTAVLIAMQFFGLSETMAGFVDSQANAAATMLPQAVVNMIAVPIIYAIETPVGAVFAGLFWPFLALWFLMYVFMTIFAFIVPLFNRAQDTYQT